MSRKISKLVNENTGEIEEWITLHFNRFTHRATITAKESKVPKKSKDPFIKTALYMKELSLTIEEKGLFFHLTGLIEWEDNFIQNECGYMTISDIQKTIPTMTRKTLTSKLRALEEKGLLCLIDLGNKIFVYMYSSHVWFGSENVKNDSKLKEFLIKHGLTWDGCAKAKPPEKHT